MSTTKQQRRRALELLEASIDGCTEAIMLAYGFKTETLVPCPIISIHAVDVPIRALLEKHYRSAFGPEGIANLAAAFEAALSKLGLVDRKDPVTMTVANLIIEVRKSGGAIPRQEKITRGRS
jgi:hypothetical protein